MHELAVTENLLEISIRHAQEAGATRITGIYIVIGQIASTVDDSVQFYWEIISRDTIAAGSKLHFERIPTEFICQDCQTLFSPTDTNFECVNCHSTNVKVHKGREFYLDSIEIE